ncbi:MAG: hypothetical protein H0W83_13530, partial [Planctomycetes bacterium]|nr:hypothetical protein [Planctomycetota bacterium]
IEFAGRRLSLLVDGHVLCDYDGIHPFTSGFVSLYFFYPLKAVDDVRVYERGLPQKLPATAIGDYCAQTRQYDQAVQQYRRVAEGSGPWSMRQEAAYKQGLSLYQASQIDAATRVWSTVTLQPWKGLSECTLLDQWFAEGRDADVFAGLARLYHSGDRDLSARVVTSWSRYLMQLSPPLVYKADGQDRLESYLDLRETLFVSEPMAENSLAHALNALQRYQETVDRYPHLVLACSEALAFLGRTEDILTWYANDPRLAANALADMGRSADIDRLYPSEARQHDEGPMWRGHPDETLARNPHHVQALIALGRIDQVIAENRSGSEYALIATGRGDEVPENILVDHDDYLLSRGRLQDALDRFGTNRYHGTQVRLAMGLDRFIAGDHAAAQRWLTIPPWLEFYQGGSYLAHYAMVPFLQELAGDCQAMTAMRALFDDHRRRWIYQQHPWHAIMFLSGEIDEARFLAQPHCLFAPADLLFCRAIANERAGHPGAAAADYRAYAGLPWWKHCLGLQPTLDRFVAWRLEQLAKP